MLLHPPLLEFLLHLLVRVFFVGDEFEVFTVNFFGTIRLDAHLLLTFLNSLQHLLMSLLLLLIFPDLPLLHTLHLKFSLLHLLLIQKLSMLRLLLLHPLDKILGDPGLVELRFGLLLDRYIQVLAGNLTLVQLHPKIFDILPDQFLSDMRHHFLLPPIVRKIVLNPFISTLRFSMSYCPSQIAASTSL